MSFQRKWAHSRRVVSVSFVVFCGVSFTCCNWLSSLCLAVCAAQFIAQMRAFAVSRQSFISAPRIDVMKLFALVCLFFALCAAVDIDNNKHHKQRQQEHKQTSVGHVSLAEQTAHAHAHAHTQTKGLFRFLPCCVWSFLAQTLSPRERMSVHAWVIARRRTAAPSV